ncbi:esterase/lipase/thioesterase family protein [gamma proteobacterium HTCC5015]|nr:esterase/lipase/thioesterase family protein [gamma proteobacterium HTCC5015]
MNTVQREDRQFGDLKGEIFWLTTAEQGLIAVTHLPASGDGPNTPVVMLPGMFSNRRFWLSDKGIGFAAALSAAGFDCWMMERRGLGESGKEGYLKAGLGQCTKYDLPAVQGLVQAHNEQPAFWVGHSFGGVLIAGSLARGALNGEHVAGLVNFSSQLTVGKPFLNWPLSTSIYASTKVLKHFPSKLLKMGPENEPPQTMRDCVRLVKSAKSHKKPNYWTGFDHITAPVLAFGSVGDTVDPAEGCRELMVRMNSSDAKFVLLGKAHGHRQDYDHVGMVISKDAQQEVWPMIIQWMTDRSGKK